VETRVGAASCDERGISEGMTSALERTNGIETLPVNTPHHASTSVLLRQELAQLEGGDVAGAMAIIEAMLSVLEA
jgi:hypothetical protein